MREKYPACAGVSSIWCSVILYFRNPKPWIPHHQASELFQRWAPTCQDTTLVASISDEVESLTLLSQEMFTDKTQQDSLLHDDLGHWALSLASSREER